MDRWPAMAALLLAACARAGFSPGDGPASPIDGRPRPTVRFATAAQVVPEDVGEARFEVTLGQPAPAEVQVQFRVAGTAGTADHDLVDGGLRIPAGAQSATRAFRIVDRPAETGDRTVVVTLVSSAPYALGLPSSHLVTIQDLPYCHGSALIGAPFAGGTGSLADPHLLCTAAQLRALAGSTAYLDRSFRLMADIALDQQTAPSRIGSSAAPFSGSFDGNGHAISDFVFQSATETHVGFFGLLKGSVQGLKLTRLTVQGRSYVGGLAGAATGASISRCSTEGSLTGGEAYAGGLVGWADAKTIVRESSSAVAVTSSGEKIGGLVGTSWGGITRCAATGRVQALRPKGCVWAGGLVGENFGTITRSRATGDVITQAAIVGGLVGWNRQGTIQDCYATGAVATGMAAEPVPACTIVADVGCGGGLVGVHSQGTIERTYATGRVTVVGTSGGGLVGLQFVGIGATGNPTTAGSFATGPVSAKDGPGGLIGGLVSGGQTNCYWDKAASKVHTMCATAAAPGCDDSKGVTASGYFQTKQNAPLSSWDFDTVWIETPAGLPALR